jgi:hypothetical protein
MPNGREAGGVERSENGPIRTEYRLCRREIAALRLQARRVPAAGKVAGTGVLAVLMTVPVQVAIGCGLDIAPLAIPFVIAAILVSVCCILWLFDRFSLLRNARQVPIVAFEANRDGLFLDGRSVTPWHDVCVIAISGLFIEFRTIDGGRHFVG